MGQDNKSQILKWQLKHQWGKNIFSVHRASFMGCVCFTVALSEHADGWSGNLLSHDWPPDLCRVFMGHQYGSQVMNYYQTSQSQWLVIHLGTHRKKIKRHLNVFGVACDIKPVFREGRFNSLLKISLQCSWISLLLFGLTNLQPTSNSRDIRERSYG